VEVRVRDVTNLYSVQVYLSFDPSVAEVADAIGGGDVNVEPGDFLQPGAVVYTNYVNNAAGLIECVQTREGALPGRALEGGGLLARITLLGVASGRTPLQFHSVQLVDDSASEIPAAATDGSVVVSSPYRYLPLVMKN